MSRFPLLVWADNFFVVCSDQEELGRRLDELTMAIAGLGLSWSTDSLELLPGLAASDAPPLRLASTGQEFRTVESLRVLGVKLDESGSTRTMVEHRLGEANKVWHRVRHLLCERHIPASLRVRRFYETVVASASFGAGLWAPTATVHRLLESQDMRWLRAMSGV